MNLKVFLIHFLLGIFCVEYSRAARAGCQFGPMEGIEDDIRGSATFIQIDPTKDLSIQVTGLHGLKSGKHGFHIHENGDCSDPGAHFNPEMKKHGTLYDSERDYHTGDLGNLPVREDDESWTVGYTIPAEIAGIFDESKYNILGKVFVIHEGQDDLGTGGDEGSETTGNSGTKLGCCVIEVTRDE